MQISHKSLRYARNSPKNEPMKWEITTYWCSSTPAVVNPSASTVAPLVDTPVRPQAVHRDRYVGWFVYRKPLVPMILGYPDPETEWHFDIRKMTAISHNLEERCGSNAAQQSVFCAVFHEANRSVPFCTVQRFLARTSRHPLDVRPYPLTPYVQAPYGRTSTEPRTYVHRFFCWRIWCFMPFGCCFFTFWEACIFGSGQLRLILSHSQGVGECQNESQMSNSVTKRKKEERRLAALPIHRTHVIITSATT